MIDPRYDFQLLLEGEDLDEDDINDYMKSTTSSSKTWTARPAA